MHHTRALTRTRRDTLLYEKWKLAIGMANSVDQLMLVVAAYMSGWERENVERIPAGLALPVQSTTDLVTRAFDLKAAELKFIGDHEVRHLLSQLNLTISAAAARMRLLEAMSSMRVR